MKIATWNVNSVRTREPHILKWLQANPVDVLCLQETKVVDVDFPRAAFEERGYHLAIYGQKSYNGVAILSRNPLKDVTMGFGEIAADTNLDEQKRVITGVLDNIRIVNLYVPNGSAVGSEKYEYKILWLMMLQQYIQNLRATQTCELCVCGDFNIALEARDIYNKRKPTDIMASPEERKALRHVLDVRLEDVFRKFTDEEGHYSWWDYRRGGFQNNRGWRIDHIYLTPDLYEQAKGCEIDVEPRTWERPSDHTPVIVEV
ncbi:MAG: exodeoxyribonuclease III [Spirulina sp. SIO3F2]|nr:exodeoxyribonuclease III [Spirulina sp. SIO3F2]